MELFCILFSSDAVLLNNIVQNFGMLDQVKKVLASHKSQMDRYREQYTRSLAGQYEKPPQSLVELNAINKRHSNETATVLDMK